VCRKHGISGTTFFKWKAKFGGLDVSDARKLKMVESENGRLKKLLVDAMLDNAVLKDDAAGEAGCGGASHGETCDLAGTGLPPDGRRSEDGAAHPRT